LACDGTRQVGEGTARRRRQQVPRRRQLDATRPAFEELFAQRLFEAGNPVTDSRGRDVKDLACRLERA
jgi:hypothetical protein